MTNNVRLSIWSVRQFGHSVGGHTAHERCRPGKRCQLTVTYVRHAAADKSRGQPGGVGRSFWPPVSERHDDPMHSVHRQRPSPASRHLDDGHCRSVLRHGGHVVQQRRRRAKGTVVVTLALPARSARAVLEDGNRQHLLSLQLPLQPLDDLVAYVLPGQAGRRRRSGGAKP
jgi:hypothetical protein